MIPYLEGTTEVQRDFRPSNEAEIAACIASPWWRINNLYWIEDEDGNKVRFRCKAEQAEFFWQMHSRNSILKVRQLGLSTFMMIWQLDRCLFNESQTCGLIDQTMPDAAKKLGKATFAWDNLDYQHPDEDGLLASIGRDIKRARGAERGGDWRPIKENEGHLQFANKSEIWASVTLRGGTCQVLHISELGIIAHEDPARAEKIRKGALNTVSNNGIIVIETTHEGGKIGVNWDIMKQAMGNQGRDELGALDWKFFFFGWMKEPRYRLPAGSMEFTHEDKLYFAKKAEQGIVLDEEQKAWWAAKKREQGQAMATEFPTTPDEALEVPVQGAIYGDIITLRRAQGCVKPFTHDRQYPLWTSWDIGMDDATSIWLFQVVGREYLWLRYYENRQQSFPHYRNQIALWERELGQMIDGFFLPHDANKREIGSGKSYVGYLTDSGIPSHQIYVVPKAADIWRDRINPARLMLEKSVFHAETDKTFAVGSVKDHPGAVQMLESYASKVENNGTIITKVPIHDYTSHCADGFGNVAQAHESRLIAKAAMRGGAGARAATYGPDDAAGYPRQAKRASQNWRKR